MGGVIRTWRPEAEALLAFPSAGAWGAAAAAAAALPALGRPCRCRSGFRGGKRWDNGQPGVTGVAGPGPGEGRGGKGAAGSVPSSGEAGTGP